MAQHAPPGDGLHHAPLAIEGVFRPTARYVLPPEEKSARTHRPVDPLSLLQAAAAALPKGAAHDAMMVSPMVSPKFRPIAALPDLNAEAVSAAIVGPKARSVSPNKKSRAKSPKSPSKASKKKKASPPPGTGMPVAVAQVREPLAQGGAPGVGLTRKARAEAARQSLMGSAAPAKAQGGGPVLHSALRIKERKEHREEQERETKANDFFKRHFCQVALIRWHARNARSMQLAIRWRGLKDTTLRRDHHERWQARLRDAARQIADRRFFLIARALQYEHPTFYRLKRPLVPPGASPVRPRPSNLVDALRPQ